ncbi:unnamed protein product, partial [Rotaria sp. Silwood1]
MPLDDDEWCSEDAICPSPYFQDEWRFSGICSSVWDEQRSMTEELLCSLNEEYPQQTYGHRPKR